MERFVHGQACSQSCVGQRHIRKTEFWFDLIHLVFYKILVPYCLPICDIW